MREFYRVSFAAFLPAGFALALLVGCGSVQPEGVYPNRSPGDSTPYQKRDSIFGEGGLTGDSAAARSRSRTPVAASA